MSNLKVLVTGGAGFIGSNFIKYILQDKEYEIINLDKLTYAGNKNNLVDIENNKNYKFIKGDICNSNLVNKIVSKNIDVILNLAAESHVDKSIENPNVFFKTNVLGTQTLLDAAVKYNVDKFIQISTDEVYGASNSKKFKNEEDCLSPTNPYSASKASADLLVLSYQKTYGLPVNISRSTNNYGPYQYPEKIIPLFITNLLDGKKVPLYGDGTHIRDWLYVKDHCQAIKLIMERGKEGETYNISGNNQYQNIELTKRILDLLNRPYTNIDYVNDRPGHDPGYYIDSSKIKKELNWNPEFNIEEGLKKTVEWYKKNEVWWKELVE